MEEKYAKLAQRCEGSTRLLKVIVGLAPANRACSSGRAVLAGMKAEGMVTAGLFQLLSGVILTKPLLALLYTRAAKAPALCALYTCSSDCKLATQKFIPECKGKMIML